MATKKRILQGNRITFGGDVQEFNPNQWENTSFVPLDAEKETVPENNSAGFWRTAGDVGIKAAQGVVDLGSGVVGLTSLASGGLTGKAMRSIGYDPQQTNAMLGEYLSDSQKEADAKVASADGFVDSAATMLSEPRALMGGITRSLPSMVGGLAVTRALATKIGMTAAMGTAEGLAARNAVLQAGGNTAQAAEAALSTQAGAKAAQAAIESARSKLIATSAISEGAQTAGKLADDAQAAGREYGDYALPSLGAGALTAGIGFGAGKLMGDSATRLVTGANSTGIKGNFGTRVAKNMFSEGGEEMLQSAQEQYMTNIAMGEQDRMKGVGNAAGAGLVTGAAMGGIMGGAQNLSSPHVSPEERALDASRVTESGALSRAANAGIDAQIDQVRKVVSDPINSVVSEEQNTVDPLINTPLVEPQSLAIPEQQITQELAPSLEIENVDPQLNEPSIAESAEPEIQNTGEVSLPDAGIVAQEAETTNQQIEPAQQIEQMPQVEQPQQVEVAPIETILHSSGKPFTNKIGAVTKQKTLGDNYEIVPVDGGYVIQSIQNKPNEVSVDQQVNQQSEDSQQSTIDNLMKLAKEEKGIDKPTIFNRAFQRGILDVVNGVKSNAPTSAYTAGRDFAQAKLNTDTQVSAPNSQELTLETQPQIANEKETNQILEGDIQHPKGFPFKTKHGAIKAQEIHGGEVVPVEGGYVVRPNAAIETDVVSDAAPRTVEEVNQELSSNDKEVKSETKAEPEAKKEADSVNDVEVKAEIENVDAVESKSEEPNPVENTNSKENASQQTKKDAPIGDFGEHLVGAKKDLWQSYQKSMTLALPTSGKDITLSKHFPEPNYESLIDAGIDVRVLAAVKAMRDEIPAKPRRPIAVRMWGDRVRVLHGFAADLLSGKHDVDYVVSEMKKGGLAEFADRIEAYAELGYPAFTQAQNYSISGGWVSPSSGKSQFALQLNGRHQGMFDTHSQAVDAMRTAIEKDAGKEKKTKSVNLDIYKYRADGNIVIGKKVASGKFIDLKGGFATFGEARAYLDSNKPDLMELLAKKKEVSPERRDTNNSRVGADIRNGVDVTPEKFDSEFGFRGVQFGNYVEQGRRTEDLNNAFDALHDMAAMIGIPNKAVSLNGTLGLAFGARGSGGKGAAMAHFEPNEIVINLTKSKGAGSLGHEWFHALDNYFARAAGLGNANDAHITSQSRSMKADSGVRVEVINAYKDLMKAINSTQLIERSKQLDKRKAKDYWSTEHELSARAFEAYLIDKASKDNASNDYLANIFDEDTYKDDPYPYPTKEEQKTINPAFDKLFSVIKSKETDNGVALYKRSTDEYRFGIPNEILEEFVSDITKSWKNAPKINIVEYTNELPFKAPSNVRGAYYNGQVYLVASRIGSVSEAQMVLFHEALGHAGLQELLGNDMATALRSIGMKNRNVAVAAAQWRKDNADIKGNKSDDRFLTLSIEEVLADIAGTGKEINGFQKLVSFLQTALRKIGLDSVANWLENKTNAEVMNLLSKARKTIEGGAEASFFGEPEAQLYSLSNSESTDDNALKEIASIGDAFKYKKSEEKTLKGILKDLRLDIGVREITNIPGETRYELTLPDETIARVMVRPFNKYGKSIYGYDMDADNQMTNQVDERPGKFPEEAHGKGDVWIDVSLLNEGGGMGTAIYQAVANFAYNNDLVFIGDPAGVTHAALLRRPEQMLSTALKFGTTEHIAPHPKQIKGNPKNGVAPIDWIYGDHVGNIQKLIDANLQNIDNVGGIGGIEYDKQSGEFIDSGKSRITQEDLYGLAKAGLARSVQAGGRTLARYAFLKSVLSEARTEQAGRKPSGVLVRLSKQLSDHVSTVDQSGSGNAEVFYSRGNSSVAEISDILRSANTLSEATTAVRSILDPNSHFGIWDRTVGTQFNKAKKDADFKKVFDASQQQIDDVAHFAIESERLAPSILRRLDSFRDNAKAVFSSDNAHQVNLKAVSNALFANIAGKKGVQQKVFTDQELVSDFNFTPKQIEMYREARLTIDTSLDRLSQSTIASMGRSEGMDISSLKNATLEETIDAVKAHVGEGDVSNRIDEMQLFTSELKSKGYMPAMRFGEHTVLVQDPSTKETLYFAMHENSIVANLDYLRTKKQYPTMTVEKGRLNKDAFAMFKGVSPETVELFAKFTGTDQDKAFQDYIALAKSQRSSMKRMLERDGIEGFSKDLDRVLASFITSNARQTSLNANAHLVTEALSSETLAKKGDVQYQAQKLVEYLQNPQEEAQKIRGYMFLHYIGGSLASAMVNLTQPILQTTPFLSQYAGLKTAGIMTSSAKMAAGGRITNVELFNSLKRASSDGLTEPHEIHNLMADATGSTLGTSVRARAAVKLWGSMFSAAESFNRKITFLAAYQTAQNMTAQELKDAGFDNAYDFSKNAIIETQGLYSKANRPNWARGSVGATLFTFKQFSISYVEFLNRLPAKQKILALAILVVASGLQGLPFADDIEDLIDTIGQSLGYNTNSKKALRLKMREMFGETAGAILTHGLSTESGFDLHGRLGMSNLLPGTSLFKPSETEKSRDALEMAGAVGGILQAFQKAIGKLQQGDILGGQGAVMQLAPGAIKNAAQGLEMASSGYYKDQRGRNVKEVSAVDATFKAIGLQPQHIADSSRKRQDEIQDISMVKVTQSNISDDWAHAIARGDKKGAEEARQTMLKWNEKNPESRIKIDMTAIRRRVLEIKKTANERMIRMTPKTLKASVQKELT